MFCPTVIIFTFVFGLNFNRGLPDLGNNLLKEGVGLEFIDFYAFILFMFQIDITMPNF